MEAKLYGQNKDGTSINGIIKDYYAYAGENISAGDLVEYVNGIAGKINVGTNQDTAIDNVNTYTGFAISAVVLDENRVFIAHSYGSPRYLYGVVVTVNGANIEVGVDTSIVSYTYEGYTISACLLSKDKVFIAHSRSSDYNLYGIVCTISGTTITAGTNTSIKTGSEQGHDISAVALDENRVFIAHSNGSSTRYLYGIVANINGTTITVGTDTTISSVKHSGYAISTCLLPNGNVFIAHSYDSTYYYLYGIVVSVNNTTITAGTDTAIDRTQYSGTKLSAVALDENRVFIAYSYTSNNYLQAIVCTISDTTISKGTAIGNNVVQAVTAAILAIKINDKNVLVVHSYGNNSEGAPLNRVLYGIVYTIDGTTITAGTDKQLNNEDYTGYKISSLLLDNGMIFVAHSNSTSYYLNAQLFSIDENNVPTNQISITEYETQVRKVTTGQFDGIAKTSGEGGDEFVESEVEVIKTGNIFPTSGWNEEVIGTKYSTEDGYIITASSYGNSTIVGTTYYASKAFDGDVSTAWYGKSEEVEGLVSLNIQLPKEVKITKMKLYTHATGTDDLVLTTIKGSKNSTAWVDLYSIEGKISPLTEIELSNIDFYKYYKIDIIPERKTGCVAEWQTSEYVEKETQLIPNPNIGHKDIVSIWTKVPVVTQEFAMADGNTLADANGDIFLVREEK
jgi:hypothetical protein